MKAAEQRQPVKLKNLGVAEAAGGEGGAEAAYRFSDLNASRATKASANLSSPVTDVA